MEHGMNSLFRRYLNNEASPEEVKHLLRHFEHENTDELIDLLEAELTKGNVKPGEEPRLNAIIEHNRAKLRSRLRSDPRKHPSIFEERYRKRWFGSRKIAGAIAATIIVALSIGFVVWNQTDRSLNDAQILAEIFPGNDNRQPTLTFMDGRVLSLNKQYNEIIIDEQLRYGDGTLVEHTKPARNDEEYYILQTPAGRIFRVTLQDGTIVWLNGQTTLRYPAHFESGKKRLVYLEGEASFDVQHDSDRPFVVRTDGKTVQVLGTQFNINAYPDEHSIKTTLLEGSVRIINETSGKSDLLSPGQQASIHNGNTEINDVDVTVFTAWKDGVFKLDNTALPDLLRQISRWYDVEIDLVGDFHQRTFFGEIDRSYSLADVLNILELGNIHYRLKKNSSGKYHLVIEQ